MITRRATLLQFALFLLSGIPSLGNAANPNPVKEIRSLIDRGDFSSAIERLRPLVQSSNPAALTLLGRLTYEGLGVPADESQAYSLFERAAAADDSEAMFFLGQMNLLGHGPAQNNPDADRDAARWFFEAARRGHADAQYHLGLLFYAGTGVQKNPAEALKWIRRAAKNGHATARQFEPPVSRRK